MQMAKVIVDIPDEMWNTLQIGQYQMGYAEYVARYVANGKFIPSNVTNGDVIKILFPTVKVVVNLEWWNAPYKVGDTE